MQSHEEKTNVAIMILEANVNVLKSLREFYKNLLNDKNFPWRDTCKDDILAFSEQVKVMTYDLEMQISRAKLLVKIIGDRKALVSAILEPENWKLLTVYRSCNICKLKGQRRWKT